MGLAIAYVACMAIFLMASGEAIQNGWDNAFATFSGYINGAQGACGYGDPLKQGYGLDTAALSTALFNNGLTCGACFQIQCVNDPQWCAPGTIAITATDFCPPNNSKPSNNGGWCNPPLKHFVLSMAMFTKITKNYRAGIVPVQFRRVPCIKKGGVRFQIKGNPNWILVLVYNVGGAGDVKAMQVKGSSTGWITMTRNWGQNWQTGQNLVGQSLSFRVTTSDGRMVQSDGVAPENWQFGQVFEGKQF